MYYLLTFKRDENQWIYGNWRQTKIAARDNI
jgi:hypothetical protein